MESTNPLGTSIRIFLADGGADGVWVVEKSNWTGKALMAPRTRYRSLRSRPDLDGPGVYVLIGPSESGLPTNRVYIGETDDLPGRLDNHNKNKDFWNRAIVFTSKDANLNKAHIRHLEARLIGLAKAANRAEMDNANEGSLPPLSEPDTAEAETFLAEMLLIYPVLGVQLFQKAEEQPSSSVRLLLSGKDTQAEGTETPDGFVVYAGSLGRATEVPSISPYFAQLRGALREKGRQRADQRAHAPMAPQRHQPRHRTTAALGHRGQTQPHAPPTPPLGISTRHLHSANLQPPVELALGWAMDAPFAMAPPPEVSQPKLQAIYRRFFFWLGRRRMSAFDFSFAKS